MGFRGWVDSAMSRQDKLGSPKAVLLGVLRPLGKDDIAVLVRMFAERGGGFWLLVVSLSLPHGSCNYLVRAQPTLFRLPSTVNPKVVHRFAGDCRVIPSS